MEADEGTDRRAGWHRPARVDCSLTEENTMSGKMVDLRVAQSPDIKPDQLAFNSSGFSQKRSRSRLPTTHTPLTPSKRIKSPAVSRLTGQPISLHKPFAEIISSEDLSPITAGTLRTIGIYSVSNSEIIALDRAGSASPPLGDFFAENFELLQQIGSGSFADVFKVRSRKDGQLYAVKKTRYPFTGFRDR